MIKPLHHYKQHDRILETLTEARAVILTVEKFARRKSLEVYWRGQMDHTWGLHSSLVRSLTSVTTPNDDLLNRSEDRILEDSREWIADLRNPTFQEPIAKLGYMQHHGIPTRLIDFTRDPSIALFFAAEGMDDVDGRLFALLVEPSDVITKNPKGTPWREFMSNEIKIWNPSSAGVVFPRLEAQDGVFAIGRLPSTQPHRSAYDEVTEKNRSLLAEEVRSILSIPFKLCPSTPIPSNGIPPIGLTFRLHINKESIRRDLETKSSGLKSRKIDHKLVYPDADGMRSYSKFLNGLKRKTLVLS